MTSRKFDMARLPNYTLGMKLPPFVVCTLFVLLLAKIAGAEDSPTGDAEQVLQPEVSQELVTPEQIAFFETEIRPLLANRCFECHSSSSAALKAGLRLDSREAVLEGGDSGPAVVPGEPEESLLIESIRYQANEMPPDEKLSDAEIASLVRWVEMGSPWPDESGPVASTEEGYDWEAVGRHWAWQPIEHVEPPVAHDEERIRNPIDQFVAAQLREAGLPQPGPAPASVFVRRVFIDLIGIPPTPDELDYWTSRLGTDAGSDLDDAAVGTLIDNLLDRPQYGQRWGRHWLDVARYSDTGGWTQDNQPHPMAWRYRDWVVEAFNTDMPYNEFVRCQLAGDLVDRNASVGTGFLSLGPTYTSDGGDPESIAQAKGETLDDRVDTFSLRLFGTDRRLRPLSRSQVRSHSDTGLLFHRRRLQ